ncbi:uncharacterized membrane protein YjgN (DUF898 family) [Sphingomonas naasensis]|uniref:DUF898 domain-containing protein n=1 Tax=Sphingomonas naasensis TaxID=1344951 RepID=A0A4S1WD99_9SPHN|nr:YjgN family protein [Sphingomonas naasensis]NIJ21746.1 uncharacterized membrane protein YjgN (DUF898 family) [Sphingomonas naasensis]TGX40829.1 DUF898 domain-containing protein [Sphingomonas naasensis]
MDQETTNARAFEFDGNWREFAPIAFTNLLLTIVTLGIYTFWARTRERQYLWSHTRFIDDRLEWTGTGLELFIGYVAAFVIFIIPLGLLNFTLQALAMRGEDGLAALLFVGIYCVFLYLVGFAVYRAMRYRLSRTYWHGIRGGSNDQGFGYGVSHLWKTIVGSVVFGLLVPWSMVSLWNERWNKMSFGPHEFHSNASVTGSLMGRYLLAYLLPIVLFVGVAIVAVLFGASFSGNTPQEMQIAAILTLVLGYIGFFVVLGLIALTFYAAYFREVVSGLSLGGLDFEFSARTTDWLKLFIVNFLLVVGTLGIGMIFLGYRNWSFFVRHMQAYGTLNLDDFTQSSTRAPRQGEGLLDAFDVGAF